jgi:hypothetical protein
LRSVPKECAAVPDLHALSLNTAVLVD